MYYRYQNDSHYGVNHNFGANYQSKKSEFVTSMYKREKKFCVLEKITKNDLYFCIVVN